MDNRIPLYQKIIPEPIRTALEESRIKGDERAWLIGFSARDSMKTLRLMQEQGKFQHVTQEHIFAGIAHYGGVGGRRVAKLRLVVEHSAVYRSQYHILPFGLFERAYDFGDESETFLSFCVEYQEEHGEQTFSHLYHSFRGIMQGKEVVDGSLSTQIVASVEPEHYTEPGTRTAREIPKRDALRLLSKQTKVIGGVIDNLLSHHFDAEDLEDIKSALESLEFRILKLNGIARLEERE